MSILDTKLHTSSTDQFDTSSCDNLGLSDWSLLLFVTHNEFGVIVAIFVLRIFLIGGAPADKSNGDELSCFLILFNKLCNSASFAVRTIASNVCVDDMSISGENIGDVDVVIWFIIDVKSDFLLFVSSLFCDGNVGSKFGNVALKRGSIDGGKPFLVPKKL